MFPPLLAAQQRGQSRSGVPKTPKSGAGLERNYLPLSAEITCRFRLHGLVLSFEPKEGGGLANYLRFFSQPFDPRNIPHSRVLTLTYSNGTQADVYFDQGFGTWRPARRTEFGFNLYPVAQLDELAHIDASLASSGKTYVVVQIRAR